MTEIEIKKQVWVRCKGPTGGGTGCGQRVFNNPVDIERHKQHCPADLERLVAKLERRVEALERQEVVIPEQIDLDDVSDDWPVDHDHDDTEDLPGGDPFVQNAVEHDEWDDDENSLASTPAGPTAIR